MLQCPIKQATGMDCPGCGIQRSFLELMQGNLINSLELYPGLIPFILLILALIFHLKFEFKQGPKILLILFFTTVAIVISSYLYKVIG